MSSNAAEISQPLSAMSDAMRPSNSLAELSASAFLAMLINGEISVSDYAQACVDRIEAFDGELKAWKWFDPALLLDRARALDAAVAREGATGRMPGVPVGVKDIFNTYDMPTGMGSKIMEDYNPGNDARVVSNIRLDNGLVAGKTVTAEFAVHYPGPTVNPWDPARSPGTSSSGSAVAVAARMVPAALASQTAGSIIRPASYCGIAGYKPSFGLVPRTGVLKTTDTLDSIGYMARTVDDLALLFEVTRVRGANYPVSETALQDPDRQLVTGRPIRVGVLKGPKSHLEEASAAAALRQLLDQLPDDAFELCDFKLPETFGLAHDHHEKIYRRALAYYFKMEWDARRELFSSWLQEMIEGGLQVPPEAYHAAVAAQADLSRTLDEAMKGVDVVVGLSTSDIAPTDFFAPDPEDHSIIWTLCGVPAISLPLLTGREGMPIGVQIVARRYSDYLLLGVCRQLEALAGLTNG